MSHASVASSRATTIAFEMFAALMPLTYSWSSWKDGNQWQPMAINGNQWQSMAINGNQWQSLANNGNQWGDPWHSIRTQFMRTSLAQHYHIISTSLAHHSHIISTSFALQHQRCTWSMWKMFLLETAAITSRFRWIRDTTSQSASVPIAVHALRFGHSDSLAGTT